MANKLYEESNIQAIANAIRGKNGSSDTYTVAQMAPAITNIPDTMPTISNGKIEPFYMAEYVYGNFSNKIDKNNFIAFSYFRETGLTNGTTVASVLLDTNKVLLLSTQYSSSLAPTNTKFSLIIESYSNNNFTHGTIVEINVSNNYYDRDENNIKLLKLSSTQVLLIYRTGKTTIKCIPITISGYNITLGESTDILTNLPSTYTYWTFDASVVGTNKIMVAFDSSSDTYLHGIIFEYSNGNYTFGNEITLVNANNSKNCPRIVYLGNNRAMLFFSGTSNYTSYARVITIDGLNVDSYGTITAVKTDSYSSSNLCAVALSENTVLSKTLNSSIGSSGGTFKYYTINNDLTITMTSNYSLSNSPYGFLSKCGKLIKLDENNVFYVAYDEYSKGIVYSIIYATSSTISGKLSYCLNCFAQDNICFAPILADNSKILLFNTLNSYCTSSSYVSCVDMTYSITNNTTYNLSIFKKVTNPISNNSYYEHEQKQRHIDGITLEDVTRETAGNVLIFNNI